MKLKLITTRTTTTTITDARAYLDIKVEGLPTHRYIISPDGTITEDEVD